jgi:hypothetical protein
VTIFSLLAVETGSSLIAPLLIALVGSGGIMGAIVAFVKLSGDRTSASIAQAQGANEILKTTLEEVTRERDYWRKRALDCARHARRLSDQQNGLTEGDTA